MDTIFSTHYTKQKHTLFTYFVSFYWLNKQEYINYGNLSIKYLIHIKRMIQLLSINY